MPPGVETLKDLWEFAKTRKHYWLLPIILVILIFGLFLFFTETSAVAPFVYTLF